MMVHSRNFVTQWVCYTASTGKTFIIIHCGCSRLPIFGSGVFYISKYIDGMFKDIFLFILRRE